MKIFNSVSDLQAASLTAGQLTQTKRYFDGQDGGGATYLIKTAVDYAGTPDEYGDHSLANGNVAVLQTEGVVNVRQFGATGDGVTDDTAALQAAIDAGVKTYFPAGTYKVTSTITFPTTGGSAAYRTLIGDNKFSTIISWEGAVAGTLFDIDVYGATIRDMQIIGGIVDGTTAYWRAGDIAIDTAGVLEISNCSIKRFETLINWGGGYYHKFYTTELRECNWAFKGGAVYNIAFNACKFTRVGYCLEYTGGSGQISFIDTSFENIHDRIVVGSSGADGAVVSLTNCYLENRTDFATVPPFAAGFYDSLSGFVSIRTLMVSGSNLSLKGVSRFLNNTGKTTDNLVSVGNNFNYAPGAAATCQYVYFAGTLTSGVFNDSALAILTDTGGSYTTDYFSGTISNNLAVSGYDAISGESINGFYQEGTWTPVISDAATGGNTGTVGGMSRNNYVRVGNQVTVSLFLLDIDTTGMTSGNLLYIQGLPFAANNNVTNGAVIVDNVTFGGYLSPQITSSSPNAVFFREATSGAGDTNLLISDLTSGVSDLQFTITYFI